MVNNPAPIYDLVKYLLESLVWKEAFFFFSNWQALKSVGIITLSILIQGVSLQIKVFLSRFAIKTSAILLAGIVSIVSVIIFGPIAVYSF